MLAGIGLLLGMIIGAGLFALPYSFHKTGLFWGLVLFFLVLALSWLLHFLYAAVIYSTPGRHRFTGYVRNYLGRGAGRIALFFTFLGYYGAMLGYGVLGADFLRGLFGLDFFTAGILFFILGGALFSLSLRLLGKINFYLTLPLLLFILVLAGRVWPYFNPANFSGPSGVGWFLYYGVLLFSFGGYAALPDFHDVLGANSARLSKKIIFWSLLVSALFYLIFIFAVLGATGEKTTPDALSGLGALAGEGVIQIGFLIGLLAVFTSYIVFGADLKFILRYDYALPETIAWLLAFLPPSFLFLAGLTDFVKILSVVGAVGLGVFAVFVILICLREKEKVSVFLGFIPRAWWLWLLGGLLVLGALGNTWSSLGF